jgi:hypothetical protein
MPSKQKSPSPFSGIRSASKLLLRASTAVEKGPLCYQDLIGEAAMSYRALPEVISPIKSTGFATHDLAVFLRTTGPQERTSRIDAPDTKKRSKSLPREILRRLLPKTKNDTLLLASDANRFVKPSMLILNTAHIVQITVGQRQARCSTSHGFRQGITATLAAESVG